MTSQNTIIALASGRGAAGVAVLRLSGDKSGSVLTQLSGEPLPTPRMATLFEIYHPIEKTLLDKALCFYFQNPNSFTGEDVVEFHVHGGRAVIDSVMQACLTCEGVRLAEPGEFSKRAFINGRMDLTEAEAIADLVAAETVLQAQQALSQMRGDLRDLYQGWSERLVKSLAYIEADIDFSDEEIPDSLAEKMRPTLEDIHQKISNHLNDNQIGERLRDGVTVAIIGAPNAGKSSLINKLAKRDVAIVTDIAGTTRDVLEVHLNLSGYPVTILDTAGLRESADVIEQEGVEKAKTRASQADIKIALFASDDAIDQNILALVDDKTIPVVSKSDIGDIPRELAALNPLTLSTTTDQGLDILLSTLEEKLKTLFDVSRETIYLTRKRHRLALEEAVDHLNRALEEGQVPELVAEDVRLAVRAIGRITGRVDVEDLLDVIFRDFCIGK